MFLIKALNLDYKKKKNISCKALFYKIKQIIFAPRFQNHIK